MGNSLDIFTGVSDELIKRNMIAKIILEKVINEFNKRIRKPDGIALFHWNRITGYRK